MHNEERERRDNRPSSASHVAGRCQQSAQISGTAIDPKLVSPRAVQSAGRQSYVAPTVASAKKKPVHLSRDDALRLQLNLSDVDEVLQCAHALRLFYKHRCLYILLFSQVLNICRI